MLLLVVGILVGAILSLRFNFLVLVPVTCAALVIAAVNATMAGDGFWLIVSKMAGIVTALQLGYLAGAALALTLGSRRGTNQRNEAVSTRMSRTF